MAEHKRWLRPRVERGLSISRVVVVTGPRQSGKTTLVRQLLGSGGTLQRLDDDDTRRVALEDPGSFVRRGEIPRAIDEIQLGGDALVRAIKTVVDDDNTEGQFLLDGSADFLTVPGISESLAGRAVFSQLWPFSQGEIDGARDEFVYNAFRDPEGYRDQARSRLSLQDYLDRACRGGFPAIYHREDADRSLLFEGLVNTVTLRDIATITEARKSGELPDLLRLIGARTGTELVVSQIHADSGLGRDATAEYLGFLEMAYLVHRVPAWSTNLTNRVKRAPKIYAIDTGLAAYLTNSNVDGLLAPSSRFRGQLLETFVVNELAKQLGWANNRAKLYHFRDRNGPEIDVLLETPDGRVVGIEVKSTRSVDRKSFKHLAWLRDKLGEKFVHGFVLSLYDIPYSFGDRLTGVPLSYLWSS